MGSNSEPRWNPFICEMEGDQPSTHDGFVVSKQTPLTLSANLERSSELSKNSCSSFAKTPWLQEEMIHLMAVLSLRIIHSAGEKNDSLTF